MGNIPSAAALGTLAGDYVRVKFGDVKFPVRVAVTLDESLQLENVAVEMIGGAAGRLESPRRNQCFTDVVALLATKGQRLTTSQILTGLEEQGTAHGESTVKTTLAQAMKDGLINNRPNVRPPGYGLLHWNQ